MLSNSIPKWRKVFELYKTTNSSFKHFSTFSTTFTTLSKLKFPNSQINLISFNQFLHSHSHSYSHSFNRFFSSPADLDKILEQLEKENNQYKIKKFMEECKDQLKDQTDPYYDDPFKEAKLIEKKFIKILKKKTIDQDRNYKKNLYSKNCEKLKNYKKREDRLFKFNKISIIDDQFSRTLRKNRREEKQEQKQEQKRLELLLKEEEKGLKPKPKAKLKEEEEEEKKKKKILR
eukprot:TRINITY_DN663_c1_g1_i1.p1 TRINITY_DN663_c1_g1~~TRINITY_DN663_c1_g1_i1.p1  ORF type:complete len:232 (-),score=51.30 TRINITY_DN663_c1_g1_i1:1142-1837(-)